MAGEVPLIVNSEDAKEYEDGAGERWRSVEKDLTPAMRDLPGARLGVHLLRVPPGSSACPFHFHQREDEVFYILSGRGVFRYGDTIREIRRGDCIHCPAGTGIAYQLANLFDEDLTYLAIGPHDPDEICVYPDSGKVMVRSLSSVGYLKKTDYYDGERDEPLIFELAAKLKT